jgi:DNA-binding NarL/FixJ family response regulator
MMHAVVVEADSQQDQQSRPDVFEISDESMHNITPYRRPDIRVLVVDDFSSYRQSLTALIAVLGGLRAVGVANDGVHALALCEVLQPEVVLMDIEMPVLDGVECSQIIKSRWPRIQIIGLTGFDESIRIQEMIDAGVYCCLSKTTSSAELLKTILAAANLYDHYKAH